MNGDFPERLRHLRTRRGISQQVLGERCGLSKSSISLYERGQVEPTASSLKKIAECFDVSVDYLLGLKENF